MSYLHGHHESVLRSHRWRTAQNSAGYVLAELRPGDPLLDVGCGPGTLTCDLAERVAPATVYALEPDQAVLDLLSAEAAARGVTVHPLIGRGDQIPLPNASVAVAHAHQVLQHVPDPVAVLAEMARVTRPRGLVAVRDSDYAGFVWYPAIPELDEWLALYRRLVREAGGEPDAGRRLLSWARAAGLSDVAPSADVWCFATPHERAWWSGLWAERVTSSTFAVRARAAGVGDADLDHLARGWRRWGAAEDGWFLVPHGQLLARV